MNTANVSFFTSSLRSPATTTFRSDFHFNVCYYSASLLHEVGLKLTLLSSAKLYIFTEQHFFLGVQVIASVLMLTREISDNKTLTIKSSYHTEYQQSRK